MRAEALEGALPTAGDVALVVEVAESSLSYDRDVKLPLYKRARVPEAWVVDAAAGAIEVYASPGDPGAGGRYEASRIFGREEELRSFTVADIRFAVADVVGASLERG